MARELKLTIQLWDFWLKDNLLYVLYEIIEENKLYLIKRELNDDD